jgi:hypothetical protein
VERWAWSTILPVVARVIPGASTPQRSAAIYARLLTGRLFPQESGVHLDFSGRRTASSADSNRQDWQEEVAAFAGAISQVWHPVALP